MIALIKTVGIFTIGLFLMAIPILCGLSIGFHWDAFFQMLLVVFSILELFGIWIVLYAILEDKE